MSTRNLVWMVSLVAIAILFYTVAPKSAERNSIVRTFRPLIEVEALVRKHFAEDVSEDLLVDGAIRGMMHQLDPYSSYLTAEELAAYRRRRAGEHAGIDVEIGVVHGQPVVIAPIEGGAAMEAGVENLDVILSVDGRSTERMSNFAIEEMLAGPSGTEVTLLLHRADVGEMSLTVNRGRQVGPSVKGFGWGPECWQWLIDPAASIGYIRISSFGERTSAELGQAMTALRGANMRGLILDLRRNPGGDVSEAVSLVDRFVEEGLILSTLTRLRAEEHYHATKSGTDSTTVLAVLIDDTSASAAEIVAGALQDHGRATVVGTRSFGKGSVQYILELSEGRGAVRLTSAYYRLPAGRFVDQQAAAADGQTGGGGGVNPGIVVELDALESRKVVEQRRVVDRLAANGLAGDRAGGEVAVIEIDRQLAAALSICRAELAANSRDSLE